MSWLSLFRFIKSIKFLAVLICTVTICFQNVSKVRRTLIRIFVKFSSIFGVAACPMTLTIDCRMSGDSEICTGSATGYMNEGGFLTIISHAGRSCIGNFVFVTRRNADGVFICDDGQSGPFTFVFTGTRGAGTCEIGGKSLAFTFG